MKKILYCFLFLPLCLSAQTNKSDTLETDKSDTLKLKASLSLTGFWQGGNVETVIFRAKSDVSYKPLKKWVLRTKNSYVYQEFGKEKADEDILSLNFLYFDPEREIYPLLLGFVSTNFRREIDLRSLIGAGVTYQILNKKDNWLNKKSSFDEIQYIIKNLRNFIKWFGFPLKKDSISSDFIKSTNGTGDFFFRFQKQSFLI